MADARPHREGRAWFDAVLTALDAQHPEVAPAVRARALADRAVLAVRVGAADSLSQAQQALAIARELDDPALLARSLTACGVTAAVVQRRGGGAVLRRGDRLRPRRWPTGGGSARSSPGRHTAAISAGDPIAARAPGEEGRDLADAIGDRYDSRCAAGASVWRSYPEGDLDGAATQFGELTAEAQAAHDDP